MRTGTVVAWKNYTGEILDDQSKARVFVHWSVVNAPLHVEPEHRLKTGDRVQFEVTYGKGRDVASQVWKVAP